MITAISSLVITFTNAPQGGLQRIGLIVAGAVVLTAVARSQRFNRALTPLIERALERTTDLELELRDYTNLLHLHRDYQVADISVDVGAWLADTELDELDLPSEGVVVLGIRRSDGTYIGAPDPDQRIRPGDTLVAYGQQERLRELAERSSGDHRAHEAAKHAHDRMLEVERAIDPERASDRATT